MKKLLIALLATTAASVQATCPLDPYAGQYNDSVYHKPMMGGSMESNAPAELDILEIDVDETPASKMDTAKTESFDASKDNSVADMQTAKSDSIETRLNELDKANYDDSAASSNEATL